MMSKVKDGLSVAVGAFLGGMSRLFIGQLIGATFPIATILVNLIGCFLLTFFTTYTEEYIPLPRWLVLGFGTGFLGAFTTFSSLTLDALHLLQTGHYMHWFIYSLLSIIGGVVFAVLGFIMAPKRKGQDK